MNLVCDEPIYSTFIVEEKNEAKRGHKLIRLILGNFEQNVTLPAASQQQTKFGRLLPAT